jgi:hypothetical protein
MATNASTRTRWASWIIIAHQGAVVLRRQRHDDGDLVPDGPT